MKIEGNAVRPGYVIEHKDRLWVVIKIQHVKPGKGGAFLQCELKNVRDGSKLNERFRSSETVERVHLDGRDYQFLFADGDQITLMDTVSFEQIVVDRAMIGDPAIFLQEGMMVSVQSYEGETISVTLPDTVIMTVIEADPVLRGQTAASSYKAGRLENGERIMIPPHIEAGTRILVDTADGSYVERAKD
jgi:elongation factor P